MDPPLDLKWTVLESGRSWKVNGPGIKKWTIQGGLMVETTKVDVQRFSKIVFESVRSWNIKLNGQGQS